MAQHPILTLVAAPVVDIDGTFYVQAGIFIALVLILNPLLFRPWLETQTRRAEAIEGAAAKARNLRVDADALVADYHSRIAATRDKAHQVRAEIRHREEQVQAKVIADARTAAAATGEAARAQLLAQSDAARQQLQGKVDELAESIANRILGRPA